MIGVIAVVVSQLISDVINTWLNPRLVRAVQKAALQDPTVSVEASAG